MPQNSHDQLSLEIYLLGKFRVKAGNAFVEESRWERRSATHLVKLLALTPSHQLYREQIIDLLWVEQDVETGINSLNKAIHAARRALEPSLRKTSESHFILTEKQQVILSAPDHLFIDVDKFESLATEAIKKEEIELCEAALNLYQGDLLVEDLYKDWLTLKRESLSILFRKLVTKSSELFIAGNRYERSIELLKKLAVDEPTDEHVHQQLMRLFALTGSKFQALKQFDLCRNALDELGTKPEPETIELKNQILAGKIGSTITKDPSSIKPKVFHQKYFSKTQPGIRQLTYQQGVIQSAKFSPDGNSIIYSAAWEGNKLELYTTHRKAADSRSLEISETNVFSISHKGEMALALDRNFLRGYINVNTLACSHLFGGAIRKLLDNIQWADWSSDKNGVGAFSERESLAVVREIGGRSRLEYPIGNVLYETGGWISHPRFSPKGDLIAFIDHQTLADDSGTISVVDLHGQVKILSSDWISAQGLAWNSSGEELWFTAAKEGNSRSIYAVGLEADERFLFAGIGSLTLHDLSNENIALITVDKTRIGIIANSIGENEERNLSWNDWSLVRDLSPDGNTILFTEAGESGGNQYATYIRKTDGSPALRLGSGSALALSPDGKYALTRFITEPQRLVLSPTESGMTKLLKRAESNLFYQPWGCWFPDGKRILFAANEADFGTKIYVQDLDGHPICITPNLEGIEIFSPHSISPDEKSVIVTDAAQRVCLLPIEGGEPIPLSNLNPDWLPVRWSEDGSYIYLRRRDKLPAEIHSYELATGQQKKLAELMPKDRTGVFEILRILLTPDAKSCVYSYTRCLSDLFVIEGLE
ncbi:MAG: hypothetical protein M3209_17920 [Acidobacteriota bacterium]|nr:hypothetical protein [Acidobacteriota bacterium]